MLKTKQNKTDSCLNIHCGRTVCIKTSPFHKIPDGHSWKIGERQKNFPPQFLSYFTCSPDVFAWLWRIFSRHGQISGGCRASPWKAQVWGRLECIIYYDFQLIFSFFKLCVVCLLWTVTLLLSAESEAVLSCNTLNQVSYRPCRGILFLPSLGLNESLLHSFKYGEFKGNCRQFFSLSSACLLLLVKNYPEETSRWSVYPSSQNKNK